MPALVLSVRKPLEGYAVLVFEGVLAGCRRLSQARDKRRTRGLGRLL